MAASNNQKFADIMLATISSDLSRTEFTINDVEYFDRKFVKMFLKEPETKFYGSDARLIPGRVLKFKKQTGLVIKKDIEVMEDDSEQVTIYVQSDEHRVVLYDTLTSIESTVDLLEDIEDVVNVAAAVTGNPKLSLIGKLLSGFKSLFRS